MKKYWAHAGLVELNDQQHQVNKNYYYYKNFNQTYPEFLVGIAKLISRSLDNNWYLGRGKEIANDGVTVLQEKSIGRRKMDANRPALLNREINQQ